MTDNLSKKQRSTTMSKIRSTWTSQEKIIHNLLKGRKIKHRMHPKIAGSPDIILPDKKLAIFLHGCFWHKCPKCYREPKTNVDYWSPKIRANVRRDSENMNALRRDEWKVKRIWEHEIKSDINRSVEKIIQM